MEVAAIPSHNHLDFDFNSAARSSPPSTPKGFGAYYFSAPTSPSHLSSFYRHFDEITGGSGADTAPFGVKNSGDEFAFDVSEDWETSSTSADELFHGGVIKPLKPPPRLKHSTAARIGEINIRKQPNSVSQSQTRKIIQGGLSPRRKKETARNDTRSAAEPRRGRERGVDLTKSSSRRAARSLSPIRDTQLYPWVEEEEETETEQSRNAKNSSSSSSVCSILSASAKGNKKWRLKDFFLFRSASEGRASDKDPLRKYTAAFRHSSFRSTDSGSGSGSRRRGPASAHEVHYTVNRAVSEDMKKKTFLPYKQGILGRLAFNPAVHALANGFGFSRK